MARKCLITGTIFLMFSTILNVSAKQKVGTILNAPYYMIDSDNLTPNNQSGFIPDLMNLILGQGTYELVESWDGKYGNQNPTSNSWNGLVGMVLNSEIDMIAADLTITSQRHEVLEFSVPFLSAYVTILLKKERRRYGRLGGGSNGSHKYKNIFEMLDNPNFVFMTVKGGAIHQFFSSSTNPYYQQIFRRMQSNSTSGTIDSYAEGIARLAQTDEHDIGLIIESTAANYQKTINCKLYTVGNIVERYYGLGVKRSGSSASTVKDLSKKILEVYETGELPVLIDKYFGKSKCYKKEKKLREQVLQQSSQSLPPWFRSGGIDMGGVGMTPTGYGISVDKAYFGGEGTCNSMKLDLSDIKAAVHDIKREMNDLKLRLNN